MGKGRMPTCVTGSNTRRNRRTTHVSSRIREEGIGWSTHVRSCNTRGRKMVTGRFGGREGGRRMTCVSSNIRRNMAVDTCKE